jgi:DNA-binding MarR family transcriptional regulator
MASPVRRSSEIYASCVCLAVQRAARATARRYDEALRPLGITSGQFSILASLLDDASLPMTRWADLLGLDRTTLQRNVLPLAKAKWIESADVRGDQRVSQYRLTRAGRALTLRAVRRWRRAQVESNHRLGPAGWPTLRPALQRLISET